jgi:hypothetical protein
MKLTGPKKWIWVNRACNTKQEFEAEQVINVNTYDSSRWFNEDDELFVVDGKTYAFSNQQGKGAYDLARKIFSEYPHLSGEIKKSEH